MLPLSPGRISLSTRCHLGRQQGCWEIIAVVLSRLIVAYLGCRPTVDLKTLVASTGMQYCLLLLLLPPLLLRLPAVIDSADGSLAALTAQEECLVPSSAASVV